MRRKRPAEPRLVLLLLPIGPATVAGGYAVQGIAGSFVVKMVGSYSNIVGLPLYETIALLGGEGFPVRFGWLNAS